MKLTAIVEKEAEGGYSAEIVELPGCITEGDTLEELKANLKEAAEGWIETAKEMVEFEDCVTLEIEIRNKSQGNNIIKASDNMDVSSIETKSINNILEKMGKNKIIIVHDTGNKPLILFCVQVKINNPRPACYAVNPLGIFFQTGKLIDKLIFDGIH
ncbi:MAG TPA: type II toxin-antitoxin system HicB family antitoxin [archaeon]|nr:type II toxin-antitoxin system HicB family antitoxin [archaeon]